MREFVEKVIAKKEPWTDPDFPPEYSSLYDLDLDFETDGTKFRKCSWKRATELYTNPVMFSTLSGSNDVKQGDLGNSYFLAVLDSMSDNIGRIKALIETTEVNSVGIYLLKFFVNGIETPVIVDDYFPIHLKDNQLAFAHSNEGELWVSLLEKGWAKLNGSYACCEVR